MSNLANAKKRRSVTSCWECYRRKQKCNRAKPCNICTARNVPERCVYGVVDTLRDGSDLVETPSSVVLASTGTNGVDDDDVLTYSSGTLDDQMGYSSINNSRVFMQTQNSEITDLTKNPSHLRFLIPTSVRDRYSRLLNSLPPTNAMCELVDIYFKEANWWFLSLERPVFDKLFTPWSRVLDVLRRDCNMQRLTPELQMMPALVFQVLALAVQFIPKDSSLHQTMNLDNFRAIIRLSTKYSNTGVEMATLLGHYNLKPTMITVQHSLLRTTWLKNCSRGAQAWHVCGEAIRQAQEMELHLEPEIHQDVGDAQKVLMQLWDAEIKKRVWLRLFVLDSHMAMVLGRPRSINRGDCTVTKPIECDIPNATTASVPHPVSHNQRPCSYMPMLFLYDISHKIHDMISSGATKRQTKDYQQIRNVHSQVLGLLDNLHPALRTQNPDMTWDFEMPFLKRHRQQIRTSANSFLMSMHRPHIPAQIFSRQSATEAALNLLEAQQNLFEILKDDQHRIYGLSFHTIDAAILLAALFINQPPQDFGMRDQVLTAVQKGINRLTKIRERSPVATSGEQVLQKCLERLKLSFQNSPIHISGSSNKTNILSPSNGSHNNMNSFNNDINSINAISDTTSSITSREVPSSLSADGINAMNFTNNIIGTLMTANPITPNLSSPFVLEDSFISDFSMPAPQDAGFYSMSDLWFTDDMFLQQGDFLMDVDLGDGKAVNGADQSSSNGSVFLGGEGEGYVKPEDLVNR